MRLLIVSHTAHYQANGRWVGWGPTVRELGYLAELFSETVHIAPAYSGQPPSSALPYASDRLRLRPVAPTGGTKMAAKLGILRAYPDYAAAIREELEQADAVHVRCPANISLLALWMLGRRELPAYRWVKYAGNWSPQGDEAWSYTLQRRWLATNRHRGVVTINGRWPDQPAHIYSFLNPSLTDAEVAQGAAVAANKRLELPVELLFVGALNDAKGVERVLQIAQVLQERHLPYRLKLVGDGPDRPRYEQWVSDWGLHPVIFQGWVPRDEVPAHLADAHFILLPSMSSEGWPKVLSEAMAFGAVPITSNISSIPQILAEAQTGKAFAAEDIDGMAGAILDYVNNNSTWLAASQAGVAAARQFTFGSYQEAVSKIFAKAWGVQLPGRGESTNKSQPQIPTHVKPVSTDDGTRFTNGQW